MIERARLTVTPSQISRKLRVHWQTVYNWIKGSPKYKPLPSIKLPHGKTIRIEVEMDVLYTWLKHHQPKRLKRSWPPL